METTIHIKGEDAPCGRHSTDGASRSTSPTGFRFRRYGKRELAQMYFPELTARVAVNRFARWLRGTPRLAEVLAAEGYHKRQRDFTSRQVRAIVQFFGEP